MENGMPKEGEIGRSSGVVLDEKQGVWLPCCGCCTGSNAEI